MKPDGTYTVEELAEICNSQLQSWEREQLAKKIVEEGYIRDIIRNMTIDKLEDITGYYIYDDEPTKEIEDFDTDNIIDELEVRLCWMSITVDCKNKLLRMANDAKVRR